MVALRMIDRSHKSDILFGNQKPRWQADDTFMTTFSPCSAKMRGANSEPLNASRLYLAFVANIATPGGWSLRYISPRKGVGGCMIGKTRTVSALENVRDKVRFVRVVHRCDGEFEFIRELDLAFNTQLLVMKTRRLTRMRASKSTVS